MGERRKSTVKKSNARESKAVSRKRLGALLNQRGQSVRDIFNYVNDEIVISDTSGVIVDVNEAVRDIFGYSPEEVIGRNFADLGIFEPDEISRMAEIISSIVSRNDASKTLIEATARHRDGHAVYLEVSTRPIATEDGSIEGFVCIIRDITKRRQAEEALRKAHDELETRVKERTRELAGVNKDLQTEISERKRTEEALKQSEAWLRSVLENSPDFVIAVDHNLEITYVNRIQPGLHIEGVIGSAVTNCVLKEYHSLVKDSIKKAFRTGKNVSYETAGDGSHGSLSWHSTRVAPIKQDNRIVSVLLVVTEITEQKRAHEIIREREEHFRALIENSLDGIAILDGDGIVRYASPSVERMLGHKPEDLIGRKSLEFVHPDDVQRVVDTFKSFTKDDMQQPVYVEARYLHKDGSWRTLQAVGNDLLDDPRVNGIVVNYRDITERKIADLALQESEEKFRSLAVQSPNMIFINKKGRVVYVNEKCEEMMGYTREEFYSPDFDFLCLMAPESRDLVIENFARHAKGEEIPPYEYTLITKEGKRIEAILNTRMVQYEGDIAILGTITDITERKQMEEALRTSEELYRLINENVTDVINVVDMNLRPIYMSPSITRLLGYSVEESMSRSMEDSLTPASWEIAAEDMAQQMVAWNKGRADDSRLRLRELEFYRKDGSTVWVEVTVSILYDLEGKPIALVNVLRDITERRQAQEFLMQSRERLSGFMDAATDAFLLLDSELNLVETNKTALDMLRVKRKDVIGRNILKLSPYVKKARRYKKYLEVIRTGRPFVDEITTGQRFDDKYLSVKAFKVGEGLGIIITDVTERRNMERKLRESEEKLKRYLENSPDIICVVGLKGKILYVNRATERITGYSRKEMEGKNFRQLSLLAPASSAKPAQWTDQGGGDKPTKPDEFEMVGKDGNHMWVEIATYPMGEGENVEVIAIGRDVTERKQMEQQLHLAGRLAAVGELAAGVAHELNNPLAAVQGFAQLLTSRKDLNQSIKADVDAIYHEAQRASRITSNLLSFSRRHKPEKRFISINEVIEKSLELHAYRMKVNNIEVILELAPELPNTMADFYQMQQVFVNIITNAEQAMTETHKRGRLAIVTQRAGETIQARFTDDGLGIPGEDLKKVFDPFFTTKDVGKGTGLGLSICYGLVEQHGGRIYATSKPGEGTAFVVEIPIVSEEDFIDEQLGSAQVTSA